MYSKIRWIYNQIFCVKSVSNFVKIGLLLCFVHSNAFAFSAPPTKEKSIALVANLTNNYELGKRYLKLGNTYREAKEYQQAIKYLNQGKQVFQAQRNAEEQYWLAVANEFLAFYYRDINQKNKAKEHISKANSIYNQVVTQVDGSGMATENAELLHPKKSNFAQQIEDIPRHSVQSNQELRSLVSSINENNSSKNEITQKLNLDNQNLTNFPSEYTNFEVENLSISNNKIEVFPEILLSFNKLKELDISNNSIKNFPAIQNLKNVRYLDFSYNSITDVNNSIGELKDLEYLNLSNNKQLKDISKDITKLKKLRILDVRNTLLSLQQIGNLLSNLPNTNVLYSVVQPQAAATEEIVEEDDEWGDWGDEEEEDWGDEEW